MVDPPFSAAALHEEERDRLLTAAVTDYAIYMLDARGIVTSWNPGAHRFNGYQASEIIGQHFSRFYVLEDQAAGLPARALSIAAERGQFEGEGWRVRQDDTQFWAQVTIDPIKAANGDVIGYAKVTRDLTARRAAEAELRRSQEQFRFLVQGVTDYAIYMLDLQGTVVSWNAGAEHIKGYRAAEVIGKNFEVFYPCEDRERGAPRRALATVLADGRFESEGWRVRKDGSRFWASVVMDPVHDDEGRIIGIAKVTRDVTERRQAQQALEATQASLFQSQKLDAIGQLTGGVAHDFNNLLMVILSSLRLIDRRTGGQDLLVAKCVQTAISATHRGAALTQRMLAFGRRQELKPSHVDVAALVQSLNDFLQRSIGPTILLRVALPSGLPMAFVDANQLELALLNLAVNARDAMPGGGTVTITASAEETHQVLGVMAAGAYLKLSVIDSGTGMDSKTLERATEPFFTTKGVGKGTGLGLSMVQGLASQSGGQFILKSATGEGTTAEIWLPVASPDAATAEAGPGEATDAAMLGRDAADRALRVLLVDDDPLVLDSTAALLMDLGHVVTSVSDALEALRLLRDGSPFDLIVADQAMPHMTGSELLALAKRIRPGIASIIATGYVGMVAGSEIPEFALKLNKPFDQEQLTQAIRHSVDQVRASPVRGGPEPSNSWMQTRQ